MWKRQVRLIPAKNPRVSCREHMRLFKPRNTVKGRPIDEFDVSRS